MVDERVLIPRPETEQMVDMVLEMAGKAYLPGVAATERVLSSRPTILEVGTGSGCVAVTLALELPEAQVVAVDISSAALEVARENARRLGADSIEFLRSDLLENIDLIGMKEARVKTPKKLDLTGVEVIVANLPYVDRNWEWLDLEALSCEPEVALFADRGLAVIKRLLDQITEKCSKSPLKAPRIVLEADLVQHEAINAYAAQRGWKCVKTMGFILGMRRG